MPSVVLTSPVYGTSHVGSGTIPETYCRRLVAHFGPSNGHHILAYGKGQSQTHQSLNEVKRDLENAFQIHPSCKTQRFLSVHNILV